MIQKIRTSRFSKVIASYLAIQLIVQMTQPSNLWALTSGPSQPEFNSFTPIGTSDMVNLATGDFNYNIPIMDVGGYPLNLSYDSGINADQEASWVGLGWNLNVGQINRMVRGIPDDFKGDQMEYENNMRKNVTVGVSAQFEPQILGLEDDNTTNPKPSLSIGVNARYNNYTGVSFTPTYGLVFDLSNAITVGMNVQTSATNGITISPSASAKTGSNGLFAGAVNGSLNAGISFNSNRGLTEVNFSAAVGSPFNLSRLQQLQGFSSSSLLDGQIGGSGRISFARNTITPRKRTAFKDINGTLSFSTGGSIFGIDGEIEIGGMGSVQKIKEPFKKESAYGYEYTGHAGREDVLDYNRQNDEILSKSTLALPVTNYTYDLYSINAQGIGGMFRPYRNQVGHVNDELVQDSSEDYQFGVEIEAGPGTSTHIGANFVSTPSESRTGIWNTDALKRFKQHREDERIEGEALDYEPVYHKYVGEPRIGANQDMFNNLGGYSPIALKFGGSSGNFNRPVISEFRVEEGFPKNSNAASIPFSDKFKITEREKRNQLVQKLSKADVEKLYASSPYFLNQINDKALAHHTAQIKILKDDGSTYVFGQTAYNLDKQEVTFATNASNANRDCADGLVKYLNKENSLENESGIDNFYNNTKTPPYAHTYLLTEVLSSDYEDLEDDGPTEDDLGAYTRFEYYTPQSEPYKWRLPYSKDKASLNVGLNTNKNDQKGTYVYGEKEIKYVKKIITKTHVALFDLSPRNDGLGVSGINGSERGDNVGELYKINSIRLYSLPEAKAAKILDDIEGNDLPITAIKTAHFVYDYSLAKGVPNNSGEDPNGNLVEHELSNEEGKLTLKQVYFTYRDSQMGKYTPYKFNYDSFNPNYNLKSYDIWGNYKPVVGDILSYDFNGQIEYETINGKEVPVKGSLTNTNYCQATDSISAPEFPFVQQQNKKLQDAFASAWSLTSIDLPSGGKIELTYESDDYQYVQDKAAMQMFKVVGVGGEGEQSPSDPESTGRDLLYKGSYGEARYVYVKLPDEDPNIPLIDSNTFVDKYLKAGIDQPIYFRFYLNMTKSGAVNNQSNDFDYVTGYFQVNENEATGEKIAPTVFESNNSVYAAIPLKWSRLEGGLNGGQLVNPIAKAGWYFGRQYLNNLVFGVNSDYKTENFESIAKKLVLAFSSQEDIIKGPNGKLRSNKLLCAQRFNPEKSWIRLSTPDGRKLGGGVRIKKLVMKDQWKSMTDQGYDMQYGQDYDYTLEKDGTSSGVATFEPNGSKENPWVKPFYQKGLNRLEAPKEVNYVEEPFGEQFFPSATVTYSRVAVSNIERPDADISNHATGKVVTKYWTSRDFPTKVEHTGIDDSGSYSPNINEFLGNLVKSALGLKLLVRTKYGFSQGYMVHTNDMNGKMLSQEVFAEKGEPISSVEYRYATLDQDERELANQVPLVTKEGQIIRDRTIGVDFDVVTDFRESYSVSKTKGYNGNFYLLGFPPYIIPYGFVKPSSTEIKNVAQSAITTKVIHTSAILKEKIATDLGARVSTINEAWDAETGQVILTRTVNEYDDEYFNFNFPAYWSYEGMSAASRNMGIKGQFTQSGSQVTLPNAQNYLYAGDELLVPVGDGYKRLWVAGFDGDVVKLMNEEGTLGGLLGVSAPFDFQVIRSGYRNQQMANMASITLMKNPLLDINNDPVQLLNANTFTQVDGGVNENNLRIVNASAVEYDDLWPCQCEGSLDLLPKSVESSADLADTPIENYGFNPFIHNVKNEWRAKRSFAYLTERSAVTEGTTNKINTRKEGYFKEFAPFYNLISGEWARTVTNTEIDDEQKWTFASEVTQYSPYGPELENRDALNRYSSAQYGYNYTLPTAVASNSKYQDMGVDGFEDYAFLNSLNGHFDFQESANLDGDGGVEISDFRSHTGRNSLVVRQQDNAFLYRELLGENRPEPDTDGDGFDDKDDWCPFTPDDFNLDSDGDGIGDVCDDDFQATISDIELSGQYGCRTEQAVFYINGQPNSDIVYGVYVRQADKEGFKMSIDGNIFRKSDFSSENRLQTINLKLDASGRKRIEVEIFVNKGKKQNRNDVKIDIVMLRQGTNQIVARTTSNTPKLILRGGGCDSFNDVGRDENLFPKIFSK